VSNDSGVVENGKFSVLSLAISSEALEVRPTQYYLVLRRVSIDPIIRDLE